MSTFFDFNYIDVTIPDRNAWTGDELLLEGLTIYIALAREMKASVLAYSTLTQL